MRQSSVEIVEVAVDELNFSDEIFASLREDYPDFTLWSAKVARQKESRLAWIAKDESDKILAVAVIKLGEAVFGPSESAAKLSTFKVGTELSYQGIADQLLARVLLTLFDRDIESVFVTAFPRHTGLLSFLTDRGFQALERRTNLGELKLTLSMQTKSKVTSIINKIAYDVLSEEYAARAESPGTNQERPEVMASFLTANIDKSPKRLLELGPGSGSVLAELGSKMDTVVAVELSQKMAELAQRNAPTATVLAADVHDIDFPLGVFDGVYMGAFIHLFTPEVALATLKRVHRWLAPTGKLFVNTTVGSKCSAGFFVKDDYDTRMLRYRTWWTEEAFEELLNDASFDVLKRFQTNEAERQKKWVGYLCGLSGDKNG